jgi:hypothetical protein
MSGDGGDPLRVFGLRLEEDERRRGVSLRRVHREVGILENFVSGGSVVGDDGSPDRHADVKCVARDHNLLLNRFDKSYADLPSEIAINIVREHCELIAPKTGEQIHWSRHPPRAIGNDLENAVSQGVAIAIVHLLEVIEIDHEQRMLLAGPGDRPSPR